MHEYNECGNYLRGTSCLDKRRPGALVAVTTGSGDAAAAVAAVRRRAAARGGMCRTSGDSAPLLLLRRTLLLPTCWRTDWVAVRSVTSGRVESEGVDGLAGPALPPTDAAVGAASAVWLPAVSLGRFTIELAMLSAQR